MHKLITKFRTLAALAVALLVMAMPAFAGDVVRLKDGTVYEGTIKKETDEYLFLVITVGSIEYEKLVFLNDVESIERETPAGDGANDAEADRTTPASTGDEMVIPDGATKIAFVTLGDQERGWDMVGPFLYGNAIKESTRILRELPERERPDIVVLKVDSGGGAVAELESIVDAIHNDMKKDFRVVGWVESAISGASFTVMNCEEIIFMTAGHCGGNVAYSMGPGGAVAMEGLGLAQILEAGREVAKNGRHDPLVFKAMQVFMTLSCDIDEETGVITWYDGPYGEYLVSPEDEILTLNSIDALKYGISIGTADTKEEVAELLGCTEWVEVGHEADEYQREFRQAVGRAQTELNELFAKLDVALRYAGQARTLGERNAKIGQARRHLRQMKSLVRQADSLEKYYRSAIAPNGLTPSWFREMDRRLRDLANPD